MLAGDRRREDGTRQAARRPYSRARPIRMENDEAAADLERASEGWLEWLRQELTRRQPAAPKRLLALWDVLEEWFARDDFHNSVLAAAVAGAGNRDGASRHALAAHRLALQRLLEDLAAGAGAAEPARLAGQVQVLVEGAIVGAMVDRHPAVARHARELTEIALGGSDARKPVT
jgi:hypothetical protein